MNLLIVLIIVLLLFGGLGYGYRGPIYGNPVYMGSYSVVGLVLVVVLVLILFGHL